MTDFDPWTATMAEAMTQPDADAPGGPVTRWLAALALKEARVELEQHPLDGVALCIAAGFVAPDWLADAFTRQFNKVLNFEVATLDEAFPPAAPLSETGPRALYLILIGAAGGRPSPLYPTGEHLSTRRLRRQYGVGVNQMFNFLPKLPRTPAGYKEAARRLGITEKQVRTLLPKTRTNVKGHKPYGCVASGGIMANDPFSLTIKKRPKS